jgi:hypothetical protein
VGREAPGVQQHAEGANRDVDFGESSLTVEVEKWRVKFK